MRESAPILHDEIFEQQTVMDYAAKINARYDEATQGFYTGGVGNIALAPSIELVTPVTTDSTGITDTGPEHLQTELPKLETVTSPEQFKPLETKVFYDAEDGKVQTALEITGYPGTHLNIEDYVNTSTEEAWKVIAETSTGARWAADGKRRKLYDFEKTYADQEPDGCIMLPSESLPNFTFWTETWQLTMDKSTEPVGTFTILGETLDAATDDLTNYTHRQLNRFDELWSNIDWIEKPKNEKVQVAIQEPRNRLIPYDPEATVHTVSLHGQELGKIKIASGDILTPTDPKPVLTPAVRQTSPTTREKITASLKNTVERGRNFISKRCADLKNVSTQVSLQTGVEKISDLSRWAFTRMQTIGVPSKNTAPNPNANLDESWIKKHRTIVALGGLGVAAMVAGAYVTSKGHHGASELSSNLSFQPTKATNLDLGNHIEGITKHTATLIEKSQHMAKHVHHARQFVSLHHGQSIWQIASEQLKRQGVHATAKHHWQTLVWNHTQAILHHMHLNWANARELADGTKIPVL